MGLSVASSEQDIQKASEVYCNDAGPTDAEGRLYLYVIDLSDEHQLRQLQSIQNLDPVTHSAGVKGLVHSMPVRRNFDVAKAETMGVMPAEKVVSVVMPDVVFVNVNPGRVEGGLVDVKEDGAISAEGSVVGILELIEGLGKRDSGRFCDRSGVDLPW